MLWSPGRAVSLSSNNIQTGPVLIPRLGDDGGGALLKRAGVSPGSRPGDKVGKMWLLPSANLPKRQLDSAQTAMTQDGGRPAAGDRGHGVARASPAAGNANAVLFRRPDRPDLASRDSV